MTLSTTAVDNALEVALEDWYSNPWEALAYEDYPDEFDSLTIDGVEYPLEVVTSKTGSEGDYHTDTYVVIQVGGQFFRKTGYYASHDGMYLDGPTTEVAPAWEQVRIWEDK